jgi:trimethylamine---corrinoid protein Co-methyltransferase
MPRARLIVWDDDACWRVHKATLDLLAETGVEVRHQPSLELLRDAGARIEGTRARIPSDMIDNALNAAPRRFVVKARPGAAAAGKAANGHAGAGGAGAVPGAASATADLELVDGNSFFGTGSDCVYHCDPDSGERRQTRTADIEGMAALGERLANIDFVMSMGLPSDVAMAAGDLAQFAAMLAGTRKPLLTTAHDSAALAQMCAMAELCGEAESFACYAMPNPPLMHSAEALDKVIGCARMNIPLVYAPAPAMGTTAPASIAATVVVGNAETLSGLVIHQLAQAGAPFVYGVGVGAFDMRTAVDVYAAPEHFLGNAAACDLARFYGLPSFAYAAVADAKIFDEQWAAEAGITAVLGALSRATLLHDVGYLESGMQSSYETIVLGNELVGYARSLLREVGVEAEALALAEITAVGPGGNHLNRPYTRTHHREVWTPELFDRAVFDRWHAAGATTLKERVQARTAALRAEPRAFTLDPSVREQLDAALATAGRAQ